VEACWIFHLLQFHWNQGSRLSYRHITHSDFFHSKCFSNCVCHQFSIRWCRDQARLLCNQFLWKCKVYYRRFFRLHKFLSFYCFEEYLSLPIHSWRIHSFWISRWASRRWNLWRCLFCIVGKLILKAPCEGIECYSLCWGPLIVCSPYTWCSSSSKTSWNRL